MSRLFYNHLSSLFFLICILISLPSHAMLEAASNKGNEPTSIIGAASALNFSDSERNNTVDVVVVDSALKDQALLKEAAKSTDRYFLFDSTNDSAADVITRITDWALQTQQSIDTISILSHGQSGSFQLGNEHITIDSINSNILLWRGLGGLLSKNANILIYSCETAKGFAGQSLLDTLSRRTNANVFGSTNITGNGGDWGLEVKSTKSSQEVPSDSNPPITIQLLANYEGTLADTGLHFPAATSGEWSNPTNVFNSDDNWTIASIVGNQIYTQFNLNVPANVNVKGISLKFKADATAGSAILGFIGPSFQVSWDGDNWSDPYSISYGCFLTICSGSEDTFGGDTDKWGQHNWIPSEFANDSFQVRISKVALSLLGNLRVDYIQVQVHYAAVSAVNTTISSSQSSVTADGNFTSTITVQAIDEDGDKINLGGDSVTLAQSGNASITNVTDNQDGTYSATITNNTAESVTISGTLNGDPITDTATVIFLDSAPGNVINNLTLWFNADTGITGSTNISQWNDQSGHENNITQNVSSNQPSLNSASSAMNFHPSVEFDGTRDFLESSGVLSSATEDMTVFIVTEVNQDGGRFNKLFGMGTNFRSPHVGFEDTKQPFIYDGSMHYFSASEPMRYNEPLIYTTDLTYPGTDNASHLFINGNINSTSPSVGSSHQGPVSFAIGGSPLNDEDLNGKISEFVLYNTVLSNNERQQVESYLAIKYGITLSNDYLDTNSNPNSVYNLDGTYTNDVIGLAKDSNSNLDQRISKSINLNTVLTISTDIDFNSANDTHNDTLGDGSYLVLGHDGGSISTVQTSDLSSDFNSRTEREWKVQSTGNVDSINMSFDTLPAKTTGEMYALIQSSNGNFNNNTSVLATSDSTTFQNVRFSSDVNFFTVAILDTVSASNSTISIPVQNVTTDNGTTATITVQSKNNANVNITTGGHLVELFATGNATLGNVTDNKDGTYTATISNTTAEVVTITSKLDGDPISNAATVTFTVGAASTMLSTISAPSANVTAGDTVNVLIQVSDAQGNNFSTGGLNVDIAENGNSLTVNDGGDGTYTASFVHTTAETVVITASISSNILANPASFTVVPAAVNPARTTISALVSSVSTDSPSSSAITIQTKDIFDNDLTVGGLIIGLTQNGSATFGTVNYINNGAYTATITNTIAEIVTVGGNVGGFAIGNSDTINFTPGIVSTATSTISIDSTTATADGVSSSLITLETFDAQGNRIFIGGETISFNNTGAASISLLPDAGNGSYTAEITSLKAELITVGAAIGGTPLSSSAPFTFTPGSASELNTTIISSSSDVIANGTATITIQTIDANNNNLILGGDLISLSATGSAVLGPVSFIANGRYTATITNTAVESVTVSGILNGNVISSTDNINFIVDTNFSLTETTISATPASVTADGVTETTITIQVKNPTGNNLTSGGLNIILTNLGSAVASTVNDNNDGSYTAILTSTLAETITVGATINSNSIANTTSIDFNPGPASEINTTITSDTNNVVANGISSATITIQTIDANNNNLAIGGDSISLSATGSAVIGPVNFIANGRYTATITNAAVESVTVSGTLNGNPISSSDIVNFIIDSNFSLIETTIIATPPTVVANGVAESTITIQVKDPSAINLTTGGLPVSLINLGNATASAVTDNSDGSYTATITSSVAETITVGATISSNPIINIASIIFTTDPFSLATVILSASPLTVVAGGTEFSTLTIQTFDTLGNPLNTGGHTVTLSDNNDATISTAIDNQNGSYTATISNTTVQSTIVSVSVDGIPAIDDITIIFMDDTPISIDDTDGKIISGTAANGSFIEIKDTQGNILCTTNADPSTGQYRCIITTLIPNGETLTVTATDPADNILTSTAEVNSTDSDNDGISDIIEDLIAVNGGPLNAQPNTDTDGDSLPDYAEIIMDSDLTDTSDPSPFGDFDNDGVPNAIEDYFSAIGGVFDSELSTDSDGDGIPDITELVITNADFLQANLPFPNGSSNDDADNISNGIESYLASLSITNVDDTSDYDHDGYTDALEVRLASNPLKANEPDIDQDGVNNSIEAFLTGSIEGSINGVEFNASHDSDDDELPDIFELKYTNLNDLSGSINDADDGDIDGDGITDAVELYLSGDTDTTSTSEDEDSDNDGIADVMEISIGSDPHRHSKPVVWIDVEDLAGGSIRISANIGGFQAPYPTVLWDSLDISLINPSARTQTINGLGEGTYSITLTIKRKMTDDKELTSKTTKTFKVTNEGTTDTDFDGISDSFDSFDGVMGAEEKLPTAIGYSTDYKIQSQYGVTVRAGRIALAGSNQVSVINNDQLIDYVNQNFPITAGNTDPVNNPTLLPNLFDIDIVNMPKVNDTVAITIPLNHPLRAGDAVLLFNYSSLHWFAMKTSTDTVSSTQGAPGACPPPGDPSYSDGLSEGHNCLQLQVTDGGVNDKDARSNGSIPLLIGIGPSSYLPEDIYFDSDPSRTLDPNLPPGPSASPDPIGHRNGGSINPLTVVLFIFASLIYCRRQHSI